MTLRQTYSFDYNINAVCQLQEIIEGRVIKTSLIANQLGEGQLG